MNSVKVNYMTADEAVRLIKSGDHVFIQGSTSIPEVLVEAMARRGNDLRNVRLYQGFAVAKGPAPYCREECADAFYPDPCFISNSVREWIDKGNGSTTPCFLGEVPRLFREGICPVDVCLLNCSLPDKNGYVSYGVSADLAYSAAESAKIVIAQINRRMPFSFGDPVIHLSQLAAAVEVDDPLVEVPTPEPTPAEIALGNNVAALIPDGATLQIGVGGIPNAIIRALAGHKHLGVHTEAMTDGLLPLMESGAIDNSMKRVMPGKSVASLALGSRRLYEFMDYNPDIIFKDVAWTNDPFRIAQNPKVMSINSCLEIDLTGQICSDSIGTHMFSGVGGQVDFVYGSSRSEGGKSFLTMLSTTRKGMSKIKPVLTPGAGVVTTRYMAHYIATEHGCVCLRGKDLAERARLLISIADPSAREELERAARERYGRAFGRQW
ncbi:MAG: acetyl-CoA hydrolase/transferase C-terminal domain-containing protein [Muribaculaceae bacterium]